MTYSPKINVLWLVDHLGCDGVLHGAGVYYLNTIPRFDPDRFRVYLCVLRQRDELTGQFEAAGIHVHHLGRHKLDPLTLVDIGKLVQVWEIDLIHAHGYGSANFGRLVGKFSGVYTIVHAHDEDHYYPLYQAVADGLLRSFADKVIAVSEPVKESCVKKRKMDPAKVAVIHNGIPLEKFVQPETSRIEVERTRLAIPLEMAVVGTAARLRAEKGIAYLLEAAVEVLKTCPNTLFLIAGDGPIREELENRTRQLGIDQHVCFAGFCQEITPVLSFFDVAVFPSLSEGLGQALMEAMALGKAVVATRVGGMQELIQDGYDGLFVPPADVQALAAKIIYLLQNEEERVRIGERAQAKSVTFSLEKHVAALATIYDATTGKKKHDKEQPVLAKSQ